MTVGRALATVAAPRMTRWALRAAAERGSWPAGVGRRRPVQLSSRPDWCGIVCHRLSGRWVRAVRCATGGAPSVSHGSLRHTPLGLALRQGAELLQAFESSPGKRRVFCRRCGSPVYSERDALPEVLRVRAGTLDGDLETRPSAHFHVAHRANWWDLDDGLPRHPARPPPRRPGG